MKSLFRRGLLWICLGCPVLFPASAVQAADVGYRQEMNVIFDDSLAPGVFLDFFIPTGKPNGLAVIDVVSGAWHAEEQQLNEHKLLGIYSYFCTHGYVVMAVRPGSVERHTVASMIRNLEQAIRYTKAHAATLHIDPERIGIMGVSAGGHLALLAALNPKSGSSTNILATTSPNARYSTAVKAAGAFFPPTDFIDWRGGEPPPAPPPQPVPANRRGSRFVQATPSPSTPTNMVQFQAMLGPMLFPGGTAGHSDEDIRTQTMAISPLHQIHGPPALPIFLIHGDADPLVPLNHSQRLVDAIKAAGGEAKLLVKKGGTHPWFPLGDEIQVLIAWFDQKLALPTK